MASPFDSIAPCSPPNLSTCLGDFISLLDPTTKAAMLAGIDSATKEVQGLASKAASAANSATGAVGSLQAKIDKIDKEIAELQTAIDAIDVSLTKIPCVELLPLKVFLEAAKSTLEIAKGAIDLTPLQASIGEAIAQRDLFNGMENCLNGYKEFLS